MSTHPPTGRTYVLVWIALMGLAALSFGLSFAPLGSFGPVVALTIAAIKATLIVAIFMGLAEQPSISRWAFAFGLTLVAILLALVLTDVLTRPRTGLVQPGLTAVTPSSAVAGGGGGAG